MENNISAYIRIKPIENDQEQVFQPIDQKWVLDLRTNGHYDFEHVFDE